eukprot:GFUD01023500.1.p1 GENE.GFUD01023500.1~~GFUD01023500.1.p1  ORF type:complete len:203 (+),score=72.38 GFUD01023500.1:70-609(+)
MSDVEDESSSFSYKAKAGTFLAFAGGFGMLAGFGGALSQVKKQDPGHFDKGMTGLDPAEEAAKTEALRKMDNAAMEKIRNARAVHESGAALAAKALGWGTVCAFAGCGLLFFSVWKLMGVNNLREFREKTGNFLPKIPKKAKEPGERTEFSGINDFLTYIIEKDKEEKLIKEKLKSSSK